MDSTSKVKTLYKIPPHSHTFSNVAFARQTGRMHALCSLLAVAFGCMDDTLCPKFLSPQGMISHIISVGEEDVLNTTQSLCMPKAPSFTCGLGCFHEPPLVYAGMLRGPTAGMLRGPTALFRKELVSNMTVTAES